MSDMAMYKSPLEMMKSLAVRGSSDTIVAGTQVPPTEREIYVPGVGMGVGCG